MIYIVKLMEAERILYVSKLLTPINQFFSYIYKECFV